jgi:hypothetical protein
LWDLIDGQIDDARAFSERVLSCRVRNREGRFEDRGNTAIPYRSFLRYYFKELHPEGQGADHPAPAERAETKVGDTLAPQKQTTRYPGSLQPVFGARDRIEQI